MLLIVGFTILQWLKDWESDSQTGDPSSSPGSDTGVAAMLAGGSSVGCRLCYGSHGKIQEIFDVVLYFDRAG
ncbi:hypothetical protein DPX16_13868 [Anabarilius grahami]|uniref:Uncharacterized protein n=1 Tax=Anabarilius grahami TaxID=495550 RepID=A0A3N0XV79_ANAGA|nr:hypothetical protein DPX16_13868 [Anabarilius grahami]